MRNPQIAVKYSTSKSHQQIIWAAGVLLTLPLLTWALSHCYFIDDAYITLRYSRNLADGIGMVWNLGEQVEGVTNFLWTVLLAVPLRFQQPGELWAVGLGATAGMGAIFLAWRLAAGLSQSWRIGWLAVLVVAACPEYWRMVASGLEGGLYALLLVWFADCLLRRNALLQTGLVGGLLFFTRPESAFLLPLSVGYLWMTRDRKPFDKKLPNASASQTFTIELAGMCLIWLLMIGMLEAFRFWYFGRLLPNSVIAKGISLSDMSMLITTSKLGLRYVAGFFLSVPLVVLCIIAAAKIKSPNRPASRFLLAVAIIVTLIALRNGGDWMPNHRLFTMYLPLMTPAVTIVLQYFLQKQKRRPAVGLVVVSALISLTMAGQWTTHPSLTLETPPNEKPYHTVLAAIGDKLPADTVIAAEAVGAVGWQLPDHIIHDPLGLTDAHIARHGTLSPGFGRWNLGYTTNTIRPAIYFSHHFPRLKEIRQTYKGHFSKEYAVYTFPTPKTDSPNTQSQWFIAIDRDLLPKLDATLRKIGCQPLP